MLTALKKMQGEKAVGPDNLPAEVLEMSGRVEVPYSDVQPTFERKKDARGVEKECSCSHLQEQG